jgi:hypothetical protein
MERSSEFVKDKALFGGFPIQNEVDMFENNGIRYFINLACLEEKGINPYITKYNYIHYPIKDRRVPTNWKTFSQFIIKVGDIIKNLPTGEKVYIHCKGGHGRSGTVVACLLCYIFNIPPSDALTDTNIYHSNRKEMREKWRRLGSPQTRSQKHFVSKFFEPFFIYNNYTKYFSEGFSNDSDLSVMIPGLGLFPNATSAFAASINPLEEKHTSTLELRETMYTILNYKFDQHEHIRKNMLGTGLRYIIFISIDPFWGRLDKTGKNMIGKILIDVRKNLYINN